MRRYEWFCKNIGEKVWVSLASGLFVLGWVYFISAAGAHRFLTASEFGHVVWMQAKGIPPWAIIPLVFAVAQWRGIVDLDSGWEHAFYREWAKVYTGRGRRGGGVVRFFCEQVDAMSLQKAVCGDRPIYLLQIQLKPLFRFLGKGRVIRVGLRSDRENLRSLLEWAEHRRINVSFVDSSIYRRS